MVRVTTGYEIDPVSGKHGIKGNKLRQNDSKQNKDSEGR